MITSIFLGIALIVFTILFISYKSKYTKLVKLVKEQTKWGKLRITPEMCKCQKYQMIYK